MKRQGGWQLSACKIRLYWHPERSASFRPRIVPVRRYVVNSGDLNRAFPGEDSADDPAMRLAASIFHIIGEWNPNLVLDLHESKKPLGAGGLGYSLIFSDDELTGDLIWEFCCPMRKAECAATILVLLSLAFREA